VVDLQPHAQRRAQRPANQADLDLAGPVAPVVPDRPAHQAVAGVPSAVLPVICPLSRAATQVANGMSTIRWNDGQPWTGRVPVLVPGLAAGGA
jgi:hypothetical protein